MQIRSRWVVSIVLSWTALSWTALSVAQPYPTRPIRLIVPYTPGSASDALARAIGQEVAKDLGHGFIVENRPGASTMIGTEACARSASDGYTLCLVSIDSNSILPHLHKKLPYDPERDFEPIMQLIQFVQGLGVATDVPATSLQALIALARAKPGQLNYGSLGQNSNSHLFFEWFSRAHGVSLTHVPYKGAAPLMQAVTTNEVQMANLAVVNLGPLHRAGKLKILAVDGTRRSPLLPDVPTFPEAGIAPTGFVGWLGLSGPAGLPKDAANRVHAEVSRLFANDAFREKYVANLGMVPAISTPDGFARFLRDNRALGGELVRQSGVKLD